MAQLLSVNVGRSEPNPAKAGAGTTGFGKRPASGPVEVRAPGPKHGGLGSGLVGDHVGDVKHHGGDDQAVYAFAREDLDRWTGYLSRELANGGFGENVTTTGLDVTGARIGEVWRVGDTVELTVTSPRTPCVTFAARIGVPGWLKTFTADARPGAYLRVSAPGTIRTGDAIDVVHRPDHDVTIGLAFRALTTERDLLVKVAEAGPYLPHELRESAHEALKRAGSSARQQG